MGFSGPEVKDWLVKQGVGEAEAARTVAAAQSKSKNDARMVALAMTALGVAGVAFGAIWIVWILVQGKLPIGSSVLAGISAAVGAFLVRSGFETLRTGKVSSKIDHR